MVVDARVVGHVVGQELAVLARGHPADLVAPERHAPVHFAIGVRIPSRACQEAQTPLPEAAHVGPFHDLSVDAAGFTAIPRLRDPDAAEVGVEHIDDSIRDLLELLLEGALRQQALL